MECSDGVSFVTRALTVVTASPFFFFYLTFYNES